MSDATLAPRPAVASWRTIARRELLEIVVSPTFVWTFTVASILILLAFWVGARGVVLETRRHEAAQAADLRRLQAETDWLEVAPTVSVAPQPISGLVAGVTHDIGSAANVSGRGAITLGGSWYSSEPVAALLRVLDLEFVIRVVLSLFALLLAHDAVCGERERGTLRLVFAGGLSRASFLGGKIAGALAALLLPLTIPLALGTLIYQLSGVTLAAVEWARLAWVLAAGLLYVACFLALATWISTWTRRASDAFLLSLSAWVLLVLVVPRAAVSLAARATPVLSRDAIESERNRLRTSLWAEDRAGMRQIVEANIGWVGADSPAAANTPAPSPAEAMAQRMATINKAIDEQAAAREAKLAALDRQLGEQRRAGQQTQQRLAFGLARISPAAAFTLASQELAGTSPAFEDELMAQLTRYQEELGRFQELKSGGRRAGGGIRIRLAVHDGDNPDDEEVPRPVDLSEMPRFQWQPPPLAPALSRAFVDLALLAGFALAFYAAAFVSFQRYDLR